MLDYLSSQFWAVSYLKLKCNQCSATGLFEQQAVSFAMSIAEKQGWSADEFYQVTCPSCNKRKDQ